MGQGLNLLPLPREGSSRGRDAHSPPRRISRVSLGSELPQQLSRISLKHGRHVEKFDDIQPPPPLSYSDSDSSGRFHLLATFCRNVLR